MDYHQADMTASPIESLLDHVDDADKRPAPTIEEFLEEEDTLRECRGDNKRLIAYLCRPEIVRALVKHSVNVPNKKTGKIDVTVDSPSDDSTDADASAADGTAENESDAAAATNTVAPAITSNSNVMKYPYVASELLSADIRELCDVVVGDDEVMDLIFACLDDSPSGELDPFVATHFSKVLLSLLKTRNEDTIKQIRRRGRMLTDGLIKHIALGPISELIVRLLDAPEHERSYDNVVLPPTTAALGLLTNADLFNGLAEAFVSASHPFSDSESAVQRRHREETMANVTATITGLTERILQLPPLNVTIPKQLSPYHSPKAVARLLDAGLFASASIVPPPESSEARSSESGTPPSSSVVLSGNHSALLHALGLAAKLMTTKSNEWEMERPCHLKVDSYMSSAVSINDKKDTQAEPAQDENSTDNQTTFSINDVDSPGALLRPNIPGETIISTVHLENELVVRFERLAQMFGSLENDVHKKLPLGSLRLKLAEFFTACMKKASRTTVEHIMELGVPSKLLDLFRWYEWSSMLHGVVTSSIIAAVESGSTGSPARAAWCNANLVPWLLKAWTSNDQKEANDECRFRAGYMGHLIKIGAAVRSFVNDAEETNREELHSLIDDESLSRFISFSEECLAPAYRVELTPLCAHDSENEDIYEDEPTDLMDMGVGEVIEGLTQGDPDMGIERFSRFLLHRSGANVDPFEDDEEIQTVDTDLSHFPDDDDEEVEEVSNIDFDHDLPPEMRQSLYEANTSTSANAGSSDNYVNSRSDGKYSEANGVSEGSVPRSATHDDEGDGTYNAFVDKSKTGSSASEKTEEERLASNLRDSLQLVEPLSIEDAAAANAIMPIPSPSLEVDSAVTEIDEPQQLTPSILASVTPLHNTINSPGTETDDSSDEDSGVWVAFNADEISSMADDPLSLSEKAKIVAASAETAEAEASAVVAAAVDAAASAANVTAGSTPTAASAIASESQGDS